MNPSVEMDVLRYVPFLVNTLEYQRSFANRRISDENKDLSRSPWRKSVKIGVYRTCLRSRTTIPTPRAIKGCGLFADNNLEPMID